MIVGKGYIIRGPSNYSNTVKIDYTASFVGVPNNGNLSGETVTGGNFYLVGNPYPSALDSNVFLSANTFLDGTLYFWTHNTPVVLSGAYQYNSDDYASYNLTGGVGTGQPALSGNPSNNNSMPTGKIAAGQAFFASANSTGTISFTNAMRLGGANNSQFFKASNASAEKHRLWLNMTNTGGAFKQMLVGYVEGATNDYESAFDGKSFDGNPYLDFYSISNDNKYVIQGRGLPFTETDIVPLGYRSTITGDFTISIDHADGDLKNHSVFIEDKATNIIQDLQAGNYTFSTSTGTFTDRFVLRFANKTLGTGEFETSNNDVNVAVQNKVITVSSNADKISTVYIYDLSGKMVYKETNVSDTILKINDLKVKNQVLLVKVILDTNTTKTYKIIF
ncbi:T9SS sorting signal type C domain-containing protein [Flavobacterium sp. LBUM151]